MTQAEWILVTNNTGLSKESARAALLQKLPVALISVSGIDDLLRLTARFVMDALDYQDCVIYLATGDGHYEQRAAWGPKSPDGVHIIEPLHLKAGEGIVGSAALTQRTQIVADSATDHRYVPDAVASGSELAVPIVYGNKTLGVIDSEHSQRSFYSHEDAETVEAIAATVAAMIESALATERLNRTIDELHRAQADLEHAALTDLLTGVGNRRHLQQVLAQAITGVDRYGVAVIGIDALKRINDHYGEAQGDLVLQTVATTLKRHCDIHDLTLSRCDSDEFVIVASPLDPDFAVHIAAMLYDVSVLQMPSMDARFEASASAGLAYGVDDSVRTDAGDALAVAKSRGGNDLWIFRPDDPAIDQLREDRSWGSRIEQAIVGDELRLEAQAVKAASDDRIEFHEVLLRYASSDGRWTAPTPLLAAAVRLGRERMIDTWVTRAVINTLRTTPSHMRLAMNWTVDSITSPAMVRLLTSTLDEYEVDPSRLIVEVTEHACITSPEAFQRSVSQLRDHGVRIALDDLGSGWSSLRTLEHTPVDYIKLDGQWVRDAMHNKLALIAIRSMVECANALDTCVIAEWVEDDETLALVKGLGVEFIQGWNVHLPQPLHELTQLSV